jgi:DNA-binding transcriptional ArsR family regulator
MEESPYVRSLKHTLWHVLAGTKGGITRIEIIELLRDRPYNTNQLHEKLHLDYKTVQHHLRVLVNGNVIATDDDHKYGSMYFLSPLFEGNIHLFEEILEKIGKKQINRKEKKEKG